MTSPEKYGEDRPKNPATVPPSTPQGPESNDLLVSPEFRHAPYPGDKPDAPTGEGSTVSTHSTGIPAVGRQAEKEGTDEGEGGPNLERTGQTPGKKDGREQHHR